MTTTGPDRRSLSEPVALGRRSGGAADPPGPPTLRIVSWRADGTAESAEPAVLAAALADPEVRVWIDIVDPSQGLVETIGAMLGLHPLVAEDIVERNQRAKIEFTDPTLHLVMFALRYDGGPELSEVDLVVGPRFLLSVHDPGWRPETVPGMRLGAGPVLELGVDYLLWVLVDAIVDEYFPVLDRLGDEMDALQDDVVEKADRWTLERLFGLKRELIELRRALAPTRETIGQLTNRQVDLIAPEHVLYFRDVYDHLIRSTEELDTLRDLAAGTLEVYLSQINNDLSLTMKRLTGVTVLLAGIAAIAGIFGMSEAGAAFRGSEAAGFWLVAIGSVVIAAAAAIALRRIGWI